MPTVEFAGNSPYRATKPGHGGFRGVRHEGSYTLWDRHEDRRAGGAHTEFHHTSLLVAKAMSVYDKTVAHKLMAVLDPKNGLAQGDPATIATRIIESDDTKPAPLRMVLARLAGAARHAGGFTRLCARWSPARTFAYDGKLASSKLRAQRFPNSGAGSIHPQNRALAAAMVRFTQPRDRWKLNCVSTQPRPNTAVGGLLVERQ